MLSPMTAPQRNLCSNAALGHFQSLLQVFNAFGAEDFSDPTVFRAAELLLRGVTIGEKAVSAREHEKAAGRLQPYLKRGWAIFEPRMPLAALRPEALLELRESAWVESGLVPPPKALEKTDDLSLLAVGTFRLLEAIRTGTSALAVKRCGSCRRLFLDRSRGLRAKHCSNSCRSRTFRAAAE